ncbi:hypothetical protein [Tautonia marina]|uniref:hypothetical protein n=1 Tax=Tautonia marina TaxID=2653855 RepID=UPI00126100A3|nr:hypothetical protein [Tautonia marina]
MLLDDLSDFPAIDTGSAAGTYLIRTFSDRDFTEQQVMALRAELDGNLRLVTCFAGEAVGVFEQVEHLSRIIHLLPRTVSPH